MLLTREDAVWGPCVHWEPSSSHDNPTWKQVKVKAQREWIGCKAKGLAKTVRANKGQASEWSPWFRASEDSLIHSYVRVLSRALLLCEAEVSHRIKGDFSKIYYYQYCHTYLLPIYKLYFLVGKIGIRKASRQESPGYKPGDKTISPKRMGRNGVWWTKAEAGSVWGIKWYNWKGRSRGGGKWEVLQMGGGRNVSVQRWKVFLW